PLGGGKKGPSRSNEVSDLTVPIADPSFSIADLTKDATGQFVLNGRPLSFRLVSNGDPDPTMARWVRWRTSGKGFDGIFDLEADLAGKGQAFDTTARPSRRGKPVQFITRWDRNG